MTTTKPQAPADYDATLARVNAWPEHYRLALMQDILRALTAADAPQAAPRKQRHGLERARALRPTDQPPPSDEEVERWLEEHRAEKYGPF